MHTLEHIGLGRYGDKLDPEGGPKLLHRLLNYCSHKAAFTFCPYRIQRVQFNAHRIFHPTTVVREASLNRLSLSKFYYLSESGIFVESDTSEFDFLATRPYLLGFFCFQKN